MTTEYVMPDGTHIRVDSPFDETPEGWAKLDRLTDATGQGPDPEFVSASKIKEEPKPEVKTQEAPKVETKVRTPKK